MTHVRVLFHALAALGLCGVSAMPLAAGESLGLSASKTTGVAVNDTVTVSLVLDAGTPLNAVQGALSWDKAILRLSAAPTTALTGFQPIGAMDLTAVNAAGRAKQAFFASSTQNLAPGTGQEVMTWTFQAIAAGTAAVAVVPSSASVDAAKLSVKNGAVRQPAAGASVSIKVGPVGTLAFRAAAFSTPEGNSGTTTATITVDRTGGSNGAVRVAYATANGTASAGSDYTAASGTLSWADGDAAAKTFTVAIQGDSTPESDETIALTLSGATGGAALGTASATLTIANDDAAPAGVLAFSAATYSAAEGDSGTSTATIAVTRTGGSNGVVGASYATAAGTAAAGADYAASTGTLSWANGDAAAKTFTVTIVGDRSVESDETVLLTLSAATGGATLGVASATLTIANDDAPVLGDLNGDGVVDGADYVLFLGTYGKASSAPGYLAAADLAPGGSSANVIDFDDLAAFLAIYTP